MGVIELIGKLQSRQLAPSSLSGDDRRACVEYLTVEGYSVPEIAGILRTSDRTVLRDRARIRTANAVEHSPELAPQMVGRLIGEADQVVGRLRRISRDKATGASDRINAERGVWSVVRELVSSLQRLGYLPMAVAQVHADFTHRLGHEENAPDYDQLYAELERIQSIRTTVAPALPEANGGGGGDPLTQHIESAKTALARLDAHRSVRAAADVIEKFSKEAQKDDHDD